MRGARRAGLPSFRRAFCPNAENLLPVWLFPFYNERRDLSARAQAAPVRQFWHRDLQAMSIRPSKSTFSRGNQASGAAMAVLARADDPDTERANRQLKADLAGGAQGVAVIFEGAHNAYGYGLPVEAESLETLFAGIDTDSIYIRFDNHPHGQSFTEKCVEFLQKRRINPKTARLTFSIDPIAVLATAGHLKMSLAALKASMPQSMSAFFSAGLPGVVLEADGRPFHNAGATRAQEIGVMLSIARAHLQMVESGRHHIAYALPHIGFATALDQDAAQNIAKLQVLQHLWHRLQREYGIDNPLSAQIHVETSMRMMTARDSALNTARTAAAAFAAAAGRAGTISVLPYSQPLGLPDADARRLARLTPLIFTRENTPPELISGTSLAPNAALVENMAAAAWDEFQLFESKGGILAMLTDGSLAARFNEARDLGIAACLRGEKSIIGTSIYRAENADKAGIYPLSPRCFVPQGIKHCTPLAQMRLDSLYEDAQANAPSDAH